MGYVWCNVDSLPFPLNDGWRFFEVMIKEAKVICCPGTFFDVNPGQRRKWEKFMNYIRISYGPSFRELKRGLDNMEMVIDRYRVLHNSIGNTLMETHNTNPS